MLGRLLSRLGFKASITDFRRLGEVPVHKFKDFADYLEAGSKRVWATWKAIDLIAQVVQDTAFEVVREGSATPVEIQPLKQLLTFPNSFETFPELLYKSTFHVRLTGNAYWYKSEATTAGDRPRELYALNPTRMQVVPSKDGMRILGYLYKTKDGRDIPYDTEEIMHFRRPHPDNDYLGIGDIEAGEALFSDHINRNTWAEGFWKNGASPSGLLVCEEIQTDREKWKKAKAEWQAEYGGSKNAGKTAWLTGKWRYEQLGLTAQEMQNIEQSRLSVENIFTLHGVPLSVAGIRDAANYATAELDDQRFRLYTVKPTVGMFQDTLNTDLIAGFGERLQLQFNLAGLIAVGMLVGPWTQLFDRGVISINELREKVGLPVDDQNPLWNQHFVNAGLVPLEFSGVSGFQQTEEAASAIVNRQTMELLNAGKPSSH